MTDSLSSSPVVGWAEQAKARRDAISEWYADAHRATHVNTKALTDIAALLNDGRSLDAALEVAVKENAKMREALTALLDAPSHDTWEGRAGSNRIVHHQQGCPGCDARRAARAALEVSE